MIISLWIKIRYQTSDIRQEIKQARQENTTEIPIIIPKLRKAAWRNAENSWQKRKAERMTSQLLTGMQHRHTTTKMGYTKAYLYLLVLLLLTFGNTVMQHESWCSIISCILCSMKTDTDVRYNTTRYCTARQFSKIMDTTRFRIRLLMI